jgi:hypothetical protein
MPDSIRRTLSLLLFDFWGLSKKIEDFRISSHTNEMDINAFVFWVVIVILLLLLMSLIYMAVSGECAPEIDPNGDDVLPAPQDIVVAA